MARPRTAVPEKEELIKLGEELLKWATEEIDPKERPYRFRFAQWYSLKKGILDKEWELMIAKDEFKGYYEAARVALSLRLTDGTIKDSLAHRFLRTYCPDVKKEEDETSRFLHSLKKDEIDALPPEIFQAYNALSEQIKRNRETNQERKIEDSKSKEESKS